MVAVRRLFVGVGQLMLTLAFTRSAVESFAHTAAPLISIVEGVPLDEVAGRDVGDEDVGGRGVVRPGHADDPDFRADREGWT